MKSHSFRAFCFAAAHSSPINRLMDRVSRLIHATVSGSLAFALVWGSAALAAEAQAVAAASMPLNTPELRLRSAQLISQTAAAQTGAPVLAAKSTTALVWQGGAIDATASARIAAPLRLASGKSSLMRLEFDVARVAVGNPDNLDVILITPREIYFLGKRTGTTNVFLWSKDGRTTIMEVAVSIDTFGVEEILRRLMPDEKSIVVTAAGDSLVLTGVVSDPVRVHRAVALTEQFGGRKVVNLLGTSAAAQVMLEVKIAEVSKTVLDRLGARFDATATASRVSGGNIRFGLLTQLLAGGAGAVSLARGANAVSIDAEIRNGLVKILAEPTIMAVSGQEGTFLAGGKIFIPVPQAGPSGATVTLEEKEFGVGLRFTPTVLEGGQINLRVTPEVSELSQIGVPFTSPNGATSVLPSITTRRASTTVQLFDGQSFAIGGLVRNNVTETIRRFPGLGDVPVLGALFRSSEFQNDASELLIIVTPRLVKPLTAVPALPTDKFSAPTRTEFLLHGQLEGVVPSKDTSGALAPAGKAPLPAVSESTAAGLVKGVEK